MYNVLVLMVLESLRVEVDGICIEFCRSIFFFLVFCFMFFVVLFLVFSLEIFVFYKILDICKYVFGELKYFKISFIK